MDIILDARCGSEITTTIAEAHATAISTGRVVRFDFNGITVRVGPESGGQQYRDRIYRDWSRGMLRPSGTFTAGPNPSLMLSESDLAEDARLQAASDRQQAERREKYEAKERSKRAALKYLLETAPAFAVRDQAAWDECRSKNNDPYGARVVRYAEEWGRLMQGMLARGETISECADAASHIADDDGITGFMYGCAVSILAGVWEHGEALRRWHNRSTQLGDEGDKANEGGGVLNPAVLSIG